MFRLIRRGGTGGAGGAGGMRVTIEERTGVDGLRTVGMGLGTGESIVLNIDLSLIHI